MIGVKGSLEKKTKTEECFYFLQNMYVKMCKYNFKKRGIAFCILKLRYLEIISGVCKLT